MNLRTLGCHLLKHKHYTLRYGRRHADEQQSSSQQRTCNWMSSSSLVVFEQTKIYKEGEATVEVWGKKQQEDTLEPTFESLNFNARRSLGGQSGGLH